MLMMLLPVWEDFLGLPFPRFQRVWCCKGPFRVSTGDLGLYVEFRAGLKNARACRVWGCFGLRVYRLEARNPTRVWQSLEARNLNPNPKP